MVRVLEGYTVLGFAAVGSGGVVACLQVCIGYPIWYRQPEQLRSICKRQESEMIMSHSITQELDSLITELACCCMFEVILARHSLGRLPGSLFFFLA